MAAAGAICLLVVEDDQMQARLLRANVERPGRLEVELAASGEEALARLARPGVDVVLTDLYMPGMDGIELLRRIRESDPALPVILASGHATLDRAVEGIRAGATDFLQKPLNVGALQALVERAVAERPVREEIATRRAAPAGDELLAGSHPRLEEVREFARQVAQAPTARVLATGESGTGKSLLARAIHERSGAVGRFVQVNCAAIPPQLLESELFGHEKGAFTDAKALKRGLVELADRGTLLLDEVDTLPLELQPKLLLFLETREVRRVGGAHPIPVSTRVVAATNADLDQRVREGAFRRDLLYRLDVARVRMPPLREMPEVIVELAMRFARELAAELGRPVPELTRAGCAPLLDYPWPGNARELRNAVERALLFHRGGPLVAHPPAQAREPLPESHRVALDLGLTLEEVERAYLAATLEGTRRDLAEVAAGLGISRKTLWEKRRRYGL
ncbi:MAG TPA: sigma-54 dependent transcriptional regulator [Longimicrobium sp.]